MKIAIKKCIKDKINVFKTLKENVFQITVNSKRKFLFLRNKRKAFVKKKMDFYLLSGYRTLLLNEIIFLV